MDAFGGYQYTQLGNGLTNTLHRDAATGRVTEQLVDDGMANLHSYLSYAWDAAD